MMAASVVKNGSNSQRGKPYALMLLLAFGAAILGVMVLHKLRERRIFSVLVKQKDQELLSLHLLFQREKELNKEARTKIEEMKSKVYSLRSQKLELDRRFSEMESTISTLRDERKVIESALHEKKKRKREEMKMLTVDLKLLNITNSTITTTDEVENGRLASADEGVAEKKANATTMMTVQENEERFKGIIHRGGRRRRYSKGKRYWREDSVVRNRRLGQSLYSLTKAKENATTGDEYLQEFTLSDKDKDNRTTRGAGEEEDEMGVTISNENVRITGTTDNIRNQKKSGEIEDQDGKLSGKPEKKQEGGEGEDEEDGVMQEAEIDRADIQRFPEFDHEDEPEETEF